MASVEPSELQGGKKQIRTNTHIVKLEPMLDGMRIKKGARKMD